MFFYKTQHFSMYFGDRQDSISVDEIANQRKINAIISITSRFIQPLADKQLKEESLQTVFLHQNHGVQGRQVKIDDNQSQFFQQEGDYLFTQKKECGIGVVTADCLPIVLYDPITHTAGIVHAGWKGLAAGVFQVAVHDMVEKIGLSPINLHIFLGPAARPCCYEVQQDFVDNFVEYHDNYYDFFIKKDLKIFFDSRAFIIVLARSLGIDEENIYTRYNLCTICNESFCSYRREKEKARRQITIICLH